MVTVTKNEMRHLASLRCIHTKFGTPTSNNIEDMHRNGRTLRTDSAITICKIVQLESVQNALVIYMFFVNFLISFKCLSKLSVCQIVREQVCFVLSDLYTSIWSPLCLL